jgi:multisubunit Na+/H+ antiporter MnhC subunit
MAPPPPPGMVALPAPAPPPVATSVPPRVVIAVREPRARNFFAALFAVLATALIASSVLLGWVDRTVLPTESFVRTGGPAITDPAIAGPLQAQLSAEVLAQLTPLVAGTSTTSTLEFDANAFNSTVSQAAAVVVASPVARASWDAALTTTHTRSVELARGAAPAQGEIVGTTLSVDLVPLAIATRDQVALAGYPSVAGAEFPVTPFVITATSSASQANEVVRIVDRWAWPAFALGLLAAAIAYLLSTRKGRLTLLLGADLLVAAAVLWVTAQLVGNVAGERGLTPQDQDALAALYAPFGNSLQQNAVFTALVGGVFIVAAVIVLSVQAQSDRRVRSSRPAPGR